MIMDDSLPPSLLAEVLTSTKEIPFFLGDLTGNIRMANAAFQKTFHQEAEHQIQGLWSAIAESARKNAAFQRNWITTLSDRQGGESLYDVRVEEILNQEAGERFFPVFLFPTLTESTSEGAVPRETLRDPLTGLPNRLLAQDRLSKMLERMAREVHDGFSLIYLDLNNFKHVNDTLGHSSGDHLLQAVSKRLSSMVRECDTVCRWGGDEFLILLEGTGDVFCIRKIAEHIIQSFSEPFFVQEEEFHIGVSLGVVLNTYPKATSRELLESADQAMYRAKADPEADYHIEVMRRRNSTKGTDTRTREVRQGLDKNEFFLEYQPIINTSHYGIDGIEALLRWDHSGMGKITPKEFLPFVEYQEALLDLESWVLEEALQTAAIWQSRYNRSLCVHINVSVTQFLNKAFWQDMLTQIRKSEINPECVYLDCLKWPFRNGKQKKVEQITEWCNQYGLNMALDDVKLNLANLNFFYNFGVIPFSIVKINNHLPQMLSLANTTLVQSLRTFQNFFSSLGMKLVVKGVEIQKEFEAVNDVNCHLMQGYYFAPPMSKSNMEEYLTSLL